MHDSALQNFKDFKKNYLDPIETEKQINIIEIGSYSVNSNIRSIITDNKKFKYTGLDIEKGPNVDIILNDPYKLPYENDTIDCVISISVFEHTDFFWLTYLEILRVLKPEGIFFLNAPSNGHYHKHPGDSWRFYPDSSTSLEKWGKKNNYNCQVLEHFTSVQAGGDIWNDNVSITIKESIHKRKYHSRILDSKKNFTNGKTDKTTHTLNFNKIPEDQNNWGWKIYYKIRRRMWKIKKILKF
jgi:SAM-dependent methyltransferase